MKRLLLQIVLISVPLLFAGAQDGYSFLKVSPDARIATAFLTGRASIQRMPRITAQYVMAQPPLLLLTQACIVCHPGALRENASWYFCRAIRQRGHRNALHATMYVRP